MTKEVMTVSEPEAKKHVLEGLDHCRGALSALESLDNEDLDTPRQRIQETAELLDALKEKVFLKTKKALTPAYLVMESSQTVADLAEDVSGGDDDAVEELAEAVRQLQENATKLQSASKQHSVIVT
jgi:hypothetical protein